MAIRNYKDIMPQLNEEVYIDPQASVIGRVRIAHKSSVWPMAVIRGDVNDIEVGSLTSIQDGAILHTTKTSTYHPEGFSLSVGNKVTVGHGAILHGCSIANNVVVGMGACILDGAVIPEFTYIAAKSVVAPNKKLTPGLWMGQPAKFIRDLTSREIEFIHDNAYHYYELSKHYKVENNKDDKTA